MAGVTRSGFSAAELAAAEWAKQQRKDEARNERKRRNSSTRSDRHHRGRRTRSQSNGGDDSSGSVAGHKRKGSRSRDRCNDDIPRDPHNPLFAAYEPVGGRRSDKTPFRERKHHKSSKLEKRKLRSEVEAEEENERRKSKRKSTPSIERETEWGHDAFVARSPSPNRNRSDGGMWNTRRGAWRSRAGGVYLPPDQEAAEEASPPAQYTEPIKKEQTRPPRYFSSAAREKERERSLTPQERDSPVYE